MSSKPPTDRPTSAPRPSAGPNPKTLPKPTHEAGETLEPTLTKESSLYAVLKSMTFGEWATAIGTAFVVLSTVSGSAVWVGQAIEKERRGALIDAERAPLLAQLKTATDELETVQGENARLETANGAMERQMNALIAKLHAEEAFTLFAEEYINYLVAPSETTRNILADYVCKLYRESQQSSSNVGFTSVSIREIVLGDFAASLDDLAASGYNVGVLKDLRQLQIEGRITQFMPDVSRFIGRTVSPQPQVSPQLPGLQQPRIEDAGQVIAQATKQIEGTTGKLIKIVTFPGHNPFTMPAAVAAQVHSDPRCRIR